MVAPAIAAAGIGAAASAFGAWQANRASRASARSQMAFQREMSDTAHQRQVRDLEAAGLNPMLSSSLGGASVPGGASYTAQDELSGAVNSALAYRRASSEIKNLDAQNSNIQAQNFEIGARIKQLDAQTAATLSNTALDVKRAAQMSGDISLKRASEASLRSSANLNSAQVKNIEFDQEIQQSSLGKFNRYLNLAGNVANVVSGFGAGLLRANSAANAIAKNRALRQAARAATVVPRGKLVDRGNRR